MPQSNYKPIKSPYNTRKKAHVSKGPLAKLQKILKGISPVLFPGRLESGPIQSVYSVSSFI